MVMIVGDYNTDLDGDDYDFCDSKDFLRNKRRMSVVTDSNDVN